MINDKYPDKKHQTGERKENELESKESETNERYQIENPELLKRIDI